MEVHSGADAAQAEEIASAARLRFDESVEVMHLGGAYHVQVGTFETEGEARAFADVARERGYRTARAVTAPTDPAAESFQKAESNRTRYVHLRNPDVT